MLAMTILEDIKIEEQSYRFPAEKAERETLQEQMTVGFTVKPLVGGNQNACNSF